MLNVPASSLASQLPQGLRMSTKMCSVQINGGSEPARESGLSGEEGLRPEHQAPWHFLNFLPLPHGQGSLRPTSFRALRTGSWWAWPQFGP